MAEGREKGGMRLPLVTWKASYPDKFSIEGKEWTVTETGIDANGRTRFIVLTTEDGNGRVIDRITLQRDIPENATRAELLALR